jgi:D-alanyl-D-alanine carboxypeptidase
MVLPLQLHRPRFRHGLAALAGVFALAQAVLAAGAHAQGKSAALILDANSGRVLHESAADEPRHPASLAKMMTLYIVFEMMEQGRLSPATKIKMSANAVAAAPSKLDLDEGDEIALIDAVKVLITKSANDVAIAVAERIAGSEENFARLMNQKARQLGMAATTFRNASGLPDEAQVTTARDMANLALHLQDDFPKQYPLFATRTFTYKDETFRNHNSLLFHYPGTDGLKTGYTHASGFNLAASVRRGAKHVIGVVFGGATAASRNAAMRTYLNMALIKASTVKTRKPAPAAWVARAKRSGPEIAAVPAPQPAERATPKPRAAASQPPAPQPAASESPPPAATISPAVEIARVRQVLVAPASAAEPAAAAQAPSIEALLEGPVAAGSNAGGATQPPQPLRWATASAAATRMPVSAPPSPAVLGSPPSTLDAQATDLSRPEGAAPTIARAPAPQPAAPPISGGFQIQVGAYQSEAEAQRQLAHVHQRAPSLLGGRSAVTQPVKQGDKQLYRARFGGFEAHAPAAQACSELKRLKMDCIVLKAE